MHSFFGRSILLHSSIIKRECRWAPCQRFFWVLRALPSHALEPLSQSTELCCLGLEARTREANTSGFILELPPSLHTASARHCLDKETGERTESTGRSGPLFPAGLPLRTEVPIFVVDPAPRLRMMATSTWCMTAAQTFSCSRDTDLCIQTPQRPWHRGRGRRECYFRAPQTSGYPLRGHQTQGGPGARDNGSTCKPGG